MRTGLRFLIILGVISFFFGQSLTALDNAITASLETVELSAQVAQIHITP